MNNEIMNGTIHFEFDDMETIGKRLEWRRMQCGMTQQMLVDRVKKLLPDANFNRVSVSSIENEMQKSIKDGVFLVVCRILNCRPEWLAFGTGPVEETSKHASVAAGPPVEQKCPILSWVQAGMWTEVGAPVDIDDLEFIACPIKCSSETFALRVRGDSMVPNYLEDDVIFVDPTKRDPSNGNDIVAMLYDTKEATFKQYIEMDGKKALKALNPDYPAEFRFVPINGTCLILGTVICSVRINN